MLLVLAAVTSFVVQAKFYRYYASPCLFGVVLALLLLVDDFARWFNAARGTSPGKVVDVPVALVIGLTLTAPGTSMSVRRLVFVRTEIRRRARPGDRLSVRGFEPQI